MPVVTTTYDGRPVYSSDSPLPEGAVCWTMVEIPARGAYTTWSEDPARGGPALRAMEAEVARMHRHSVLDEAIAAAGGRPSTWTVAHKRTYLACLLAARMFPLRLAKPPHSCGYCGCIEPYTMGLWEGQDWPRCPSCQGC